MRTGLLDSLRFARGWSSPRKDLREEEVRIPVESEASGQVPATLLEPPVSRPLPAWLVLHGITRPGRHHEALRQFTGALASTGARVLIPEIPPWRELHFEPARAQAILRSAIRWLAADPGTAPGGVLLAGFSFGGPQAIHAAAQPDLAEYLKGVLAWGSYAELGRTVRFHFTGEHEYEGRGYRLEPDPYGRWIVGANCLPLTPGYEEAVDVAEGLRRLAASCGDLQIPAGDPAMSPLREEVRRGLSTGHRALFDLFAPPSGLSPSREEAHALADRMVEATRSSLPLLDPVAEVDCISVPLRLLHGRGDILIPFTETLRMADRLQIHSSDLKTGITGLFTHSGGDQERAGLWPELRENLHFLRVLRRVFEIA